MTQKIALGRIVPEAFLFSDELKCGGRLLQSRNILFEISGELLYGRMSENYVGLRGAEDGERELYDEPICRTDGKIWKIIGASG